MNKISSTIWWTLGIMIIVVILFVWNYNISHAPGRAITNPKNLPGIQTTLAPWPAEINHLRDRLHAISLPALSAEGTALHIHQHLDIIINGKAVALPNGIGINQSAGFISPIHVHDDTGVIHVESPVIETFTLGQFFDIWGVQFTEQSIGGYSVDANNSLKVFVNGKLYQSDPRLLSLTAHQEIVIVYGTTQEATSTIPSSYIFSSGE